MKQKLVGLRDRAVKFVTAKPNARELFGSAVDALTAVITTFVVFTSIAAFALLLPPGEDPITYVWGRLIAQFTADMGVRLPRPDLAVPSALIGLGIALFVVAAPFALSGKRSVVMPDRPTAGPIETVDGHVVIGTSGDEI